MVSGESCKLGILVLKAQGRAGDLIPGPGKSFVVGGPEADIDLPGAASVKIETCGGSIFIENASDDAAITINGSPAPRAGQIEIGPGTEIGSGECIWTVLAASWFAYRASDVVLFGRAAGTVNYALFRCAIPLVDEVRACNVGAAPTGPLELTIDLKGYSESRVTTIPPIDPGQTVRISDAAPPLNGDALRVVTEPAEATLTLSIAGAAAKPMTRKVRVIGLWDWSHEAEVRQTAAAFASPRDPQVERVLLDAQRGAEGLVGMLKRGTPDAEVTIMRVIYDHLAKCAIRYEQPASVDGYQTVRTPSRVFQAEGDQMTGVGTCLDLALLFASCLEYLGLCPLVVFTGSDCTEPTHALLGCWAGSTPSFRPVIREAGRLRAEVAAGNLFILECTGFAEGATAQEGKLSFDEATGRASDHLNAAEWASAVDIATLRPPYGSITPLWHPTLSPTVAQIYMLALEFANGKRSRTLETVHLLSGLLSAKGEVTRKLFEGISMDPEIVRARLSTLVPVGTSVLDVTPTKNYRKCTRLAEQCAEILPGSMVREEHLWWAILENPSRNLVAVFKHIGLDVEVISHRLAEFLPSRLIDMDRSSVPIDALM